MSSEQHPDGPRAGTPTEHTAQPGGGAAGAGADPWTPLDRPPAGPRSRRPGPLMTVGLVMFAVGVVFSIAAAVAPFVLDHDAPTYLYLGAMFFTPVGFLLTVVPGLLAARSPREPDHGTETAS